MKTTTKLLTLAALLATLCASSPAQDPAAAGSPPAAAPSQLPPASLPDPPAVAAPVPADPADPAAPAPADPAAPVAAPQLELPPRVPPPLPAAVPAPPPVAPVEEIPAEVPVAPDDPDQDFVEEEGGWRINDANLNDIFQFLAKAAGRQYFHNTKLATAEFKVTGHLNEGNPLQQMEDLGFMYGLTLYTKGDTIYALTEAQLTQLPSSEFHYQLSYLRPTDMDQIKELIKPVLYSREQTPRRRAAQWTLLTALKTLLKLMHPIMPFLTEEIWQNVVADGASIMVSPYPEMDAGLEDGEAERRMGLIVEVITRIRNIRGEMNIAPSKKLKVVVSAPDAALSGVLDEGRDFIVNLGNLEMLTIGVNLEEPKGSAIGVAGLSRVFVLMEGMIDIAGERSRLEKELARVDKDLSVVSRKLANRDFMAKAAEDVVKKEQQKYEAFREKHRVLEAAIRKLDEMGKP